MTPLVGIHYNDEQNIPDPSRARQHQVQAWLIAQPVVWRGKADMWKAILQCTKLKWRNPLVTLMLFALVGARSAIAMSLGCERWS